MYPKLNFFPNSKRFTWLFLCKLCQSHQCWRPFFSWWWRWCSILPGSERTPESQKRTWSDRLLSQPPHKTQTNENIKKLSENLLKWTWNVWILDSSVAEPDVSGLPGSGSISMRYRYGSGSGSGSRSFNHQAKMVRNTLILRYSFVTSYDFLSLEHDVNVTSKSRQSANKSKKKIIFSCRLEGHWRK